MRTHQCCIKSSQSACHTPTQPSQVRDTGAMDWTRLLLPEHGGPGESPGYQQVLADMRANPKQPKPKRASSRTTKPAVFPSAKHASID